MIETRDIEIREESPSWNNSVAVYRVGLNQELNKLEGEGTYRRFLQKGIFSIFEKDNHYVLMADRPNLSEEEDQNSLFGVNKISELRIAKSRLLQAARDYATEIGKDYFARKKIDLHISEDSLC